MYVEIGTFGEYGSVQPKVGHLVCLRSDARNPGYCPYMTSIITDIRDGVVHMQRPMGRLRGFLHNQPIMLTFENYNVELYRFIETHYFYTVGKSGEPMNAD